MIDNNRVGSLSRYQVARRHHCIYSAFRCVLHYQHDAKVEECVITVITH